MDTTGNDFPTGSDSDSPLSSVTTMWSDSDVKDSELQLDDSLNYSQLAKSSGSEEVLDIAMSPGLYCTAASTRARRQTTIKSYVQQPLPAIEDEDGLVDSLDDEDEQTAAPANVKKPSAAPRGRATKMKPPVTLKKTKNTKVTSAKASTREAIESSIKSPMITPKDGQQQLDFSRQTAKCTLADTGHLTPPPSSVKKAKKMLSTPNVTPELPSSPAADVDDSPLAKRRCSGRKITLSEKPASQ
jgi:hypothetical protein